MSYRNRPIPVGETIPLAGEFGTENTSLPENASLVAFSPCQPSGHASAQDISLATDAFEASEGVYLCNNLIL